MLWQTDFYFDISSAPRVHREEADLKATCQDAREQIFDVPGGDPCEWDAIARWESEGGFIIGTETKRSG